VAYRCHGCTLQQSRRAEHSISLHLTVVPSNAYGAGKTTIVRILSTLIPPDAGTASVLGHDLHGEADAVRAVILDEPTTGLDPRSRHTVWQLIRDLVAEGVTILLTTQYLEEADQLAGRVAVLDRGRIVAEGTPGDLKRRIPGAHIRLRFADAASLEAAAQALREGTRDDEELVLRVPTADGIASLRDVLARLGDGMAVEDLSIAQLVATSVGVSSPAWDRLTEIAKEHMTGR
jgi:ABC-type multidrug transport system ATPase subunit